MIPLGQIRSRVRTKKEAESDAKWTDDGINAAINEGLEELAEQALFYERYVMLPLIDNATYYDLRGLVPATFIAVTKVWDPQNNSWLEPIAQEDLGFRWEDSVGEPQCFFVRGAWWLGLWPKVGESIGHVRVHFAGVPPQLTYDQAVLSDLPDHYEPALEDYALYELCSQDGETELAMAHWSDYARQEEDLANFVGRRTVTARVGRIGGRR